jgi:hypothetical protein
MVKQGTVILLTESSKKYKVIKKLDDLGHGEGGWLCVDMDANTENEIDSISPFDCWRITNRYLEIQIQRGLIKIAKDENNN